MNGYLYRGKPDLEAQNEAIMASRAGRISYAARQDPGPKWPAGEEKCRNGHPYSDENTAIRPDGTRRCRACRIESRRRREAAA